MYKELKVVAIIPALDEEKAIGRVVDGLNQLSLHCDGEDQTIVDHIIVCDNGSTDKTAEVAESQGAIVVKEPRMGYGQACLTAIEALPDCDIVLFVDGDDSCQITDAIPMLEGISQGLDVAIGSRVLGTMQPGALTIPQRFGNWLAAKLIHWFWEYKISDLGPFRAIRTQTLKRISMQDKAFGWTVEMQIKAIQYGYAMSEFPADSKVRIGQSKISGTVKGTIGAGKGILGTIFKLRWQQASYITANMQE
jgi:glycosyltransferase involved in cell wall biosynthesis